MDQHKAFESVDHDVLPDRYSPVALALIHKLEFEFSLLLIFT